MFGTLFFKECKMKFYNVKKNMDYMMEHRKTRRARRY